jgi:hypothetical protein
MGNAFIHNPHFPAEDEQLATSEYPRTQEQDEDLGIAFMKCDNYD